MKKNILLNQSSIAGTLKHFNAEPLEFSFSRISIFDSGGVVAPRSSACGSRAAVSLSKQRNKLYLCLSSHANHFTEIQQSL